jgi:hypothetical protein
MEDLSTDELANILSYVGYSTPYERVNSRFSYAAQFERERLMEYMDRTYPGWINLTYVPIYANMAALDDRWDLALTMFDFYGCEDVLITILYLLHAFQIENLADQLIEKCGSPIGSIEPIVVYHMWRLNMPDKEQALQEMVDKYVQKLHDGTYRIFIYQLIGFISPDMRIYIIEHILPQDTDDRYHDLKVWMNGISRDHRFKDKYLRKTLHPYSQLFEYSTDTFHQHVLYAYWESPSISTLVALGTTPILTAQMEKVFNDTKDVNILTSMGNIILLMEHPSLMDEEEMDRFANEYGNVANSHFRKKLQRLHFFGII